ncbi:MAG: peptidylprolyl isomerase [Pseudomonadota bacterium]
MQTKNEAVIETSMGTIVIDLLPNVAPKTVENFKKLVSEKFYDGTAFHRVIPGFMIQGGDPNTRSPNRSEHGKGGPGYTIPAEFSPERHTRGTVSMARRSDPNSAGSQFFIVIQDASHLDGQYTVFGRVKEGMDVADKIVAVPRDAGDNPTQPIPLKITLR